MKFFFNFIYTPKQKNSPSSPTSYGSHRIFAVLTKLGQTLSADELSTQTNEISANSIELKVRVFQPQISYGKNSILNIEQNNNHSVLRNTVSVMAPLYMFTDTKRILPVYLLEYYRVPPSPAPSLFSSSLPIGIL